MASRSVEKLSSRSVENLRGILAIHLHQYQNVLVHVRLMLADAKPKTMEAKIWLEVRGKRSLEYYNELIVEVRLVNMPLPLIDKEYNNTDTCLSSMNKLYKASDKCEELMVQLKEMREDLDELKADGTQMVCRSMVDKLGLRIERFHDETIQQMRDYLFISELIALKDDGEIQPSVFDDDLDNLNDLVARTDKCKCICDGGSRAIYDKHGHKYPRDLKYSVIRRTIGY